jgi:hypothetical protein
VKLFLAEQKLLAVSRDGSPTDTSGTESEFPRSSTAAVTISRSGLSSCAVDVPTALPLAEDLRDVAVENIELVGTTVEGVIRVRNLAFEKWIRCALDRWQTASEVTARYKESLPNCTMDRFIFTIKLADVLSHAEEKSLYLAVRYSVAGREVWDNNSGRNYHVQIVREKVSKANKETVVEKPQGSSHADNIVDLRHQLKQAGIQAWPLIRDS